MNITLKPTLPAMAMAQTRFGDAQATLDTKLKTEIDRVMALVGESGTQTFFLSDDIEVRLFKPLYSLNHHLFVSGPAWQTGNYQFDLDGNFVTAIVDKIRYTAPPNMLKNALLHLLKQITPDTPTARPQPDADEASD